MSFPLIISIFVAQTQCFYDSCASRDLRNIKIITTVKTCYILLQLGQTQCLCGILLFLTLGSTIIEYFAYICFGANGASVYGYCLYIYMVLIYLYIYRTVTYITSPICPKIRSGTFTKQHRLLYIVVGEVIFSPIDEKIFSEQLCVYCRPNRFLVHTLLYTLCSKHNNGVFIRDRMRSATRLWLGLSKAGQSKCTLRYFAQTANNIPALIRYRFMTLTCLVGRHSGRESGSVRVRLQLSVRLKLQPPDYVFYSLNPTLVAVIFYHANRHDV